jgi:hypothetical protein
MVAVPSRPLVKAVDCHPPTTQESTFDAPDPDRAAPEPAGEVSGAPPATADGLGEALELRPPNGPAQPEMSANEIGTASAFNALFIRNVLR